MRIHGLACFVLASVLALPALAVDTAEGVDRLLDQADGVRSADPAKLQKLLVQLNASAGVDTTPRKERLQYLNAYALGFAGQYTEAIAIAQDLVDHSLDLDTRVRAGAFIVNARAATRDFTAGLRQLQQTLPLLDRVKNSDYREHVLGIAAVLHNQTGQYSLAEEYAKRIIATTTSARAHCFAGQSRVEALQRLGELDDERIATDVIDLCASLKERAVANLARAGLARKWAQSGERARAITLLRSHLEEVRKTRYAVLISEFESLLGEYELAEGHQAEAESHAKAALAQNIKVDFTEALVRSNRTLYEIAETRGDVKAGLFYYKRFAEADKAYLDEVTARELAYQIVQQETQQKSQQIELLDRKNQVLQLQQKVNEQKSQTSRLLILILLMLLGSIAFWAYKVKRMQKSLRRMAEYDALTTVCSRHHFNQQSELSLQQAARAGEDAALIMFDLDHFKSINDRFGHVTGDWVLRQVAEGCKGFCRRIDHLGRLGGEEFAILLSGCDLRAATRVAEDCRVRIASIDSESSGHKFLVTASFGVTATVLSGYDLAKLLSHADMMLYRAKREGRNRVCTFDGEMLAWPQTPVMVDNEAPMSHAVA